jgi:M6 family metalloprotease-like protein
MRTKFYLIIILTFSIFANQKILPAPFDTGMKTFHQPNGAFFTGRMWGDEFISWAETIEGYSFVETFEGWYYYATLDQNGEYMPTNYKVGIDSPPTSSYKLERSQARLDEIRQQIVHFNQQIENNRQWYAQKQAEADADGQPVTLKVGIILIEFTDTTRYKTPPQGNRPNGYFTADFDSMMFSYNYWIGAGINSPHPEEEEVFGSFRDYWDQISCGKLKIEGRVANPTDENGVPEWLMADSTEKYYYGLNPGNEYDSLARTAIRKALLERYIDTTNKNAPNYFDKLVIVYARDVMWGGALKVNGQHVGGKYIFLAERSSYKLFHGEDWSFTHMGNYAHEFGHNIGFYDEYYNGFLLPLDNFPTNGWPTDIYNFCLMGFGIYNGPLSKGECPATLSPYYRINKNWVTPIVLTNDTSNLIVEYNYADPKFYRINPLYATNDEHFILEDKCRTGFDLYIPGIPADSVEQPGRLLVWHNLVDLRSLEHSYDYDRINITPADDSLDKETQLYDFFPKQFNPNHQNLNDTTNPGASLGGVIDGILSNVRPAHFALNGIQKLENGNTLIDEIKLNHAIIRTDISSGWQIVSVPVVPENFSVNSIFPTHIGTIYAYVPGSGYVAVSTLGNGPGYWADFGSKQEVYHSGLTIDSLSIAVPQGFSFLGSISYTIKVSDIFTEQTGLISSIYRYVPGSGYQLMNGQDIIEPGIGYWLNASQSGTVILAKTDGLLKLNSLSDINLADLDKFTVTDSLGNQQSLYVANIDIDSTLGTFDRNMPPPMPFLEFDARFNYGEYIKAVSADSGLVDLEIDVESIDYPITLNWELNPENGIDYSFINDSTLGKVSRITDKNGLTKFTKNTEGKIKLFGKANYIIRKDQIPNRYKLSQNYPNPFNPTTIIRFDIPERTNVELSVYNILGQKVKTLIANETKDPGRYEVSFNGNSLASGVFLYRLTTKNYTQSRKMLLIK